MNKKTIKAKQQEAVNELQEMRHKLDRFVDGITPQGCWFPNEDFGFAEGQVNTMIGVAAQQISEALSAFEDCCVEGVKFKERT